MQILRLPEVVARTGLSRATIYRYISLDQFPNQIPLGPRVAGWLESEIDDWLSARASMRVCRGRPRKSAPANSRN